MQEVKDTTEVIKRIKGAAPCSAQAGRDPGRVDRLHDDRRQRLVHRIAKTIEMQAAARGAHELLARYELTRAYRSSIARKAVRTRRRNQNDVIDAPVETPAE